MIGLPARRSLDGPVDPADPYNTRRRVALRLAVSQVVFALATLPVWVFLGLAKMDGANSALRQNLLSAVVVAYPLTVLVGAVLSWRAWRGGRYQAALRETSLPLLFLVPLAVFYVATQF